MIKVLFDHEIFSEQLYGGISRYFSILANEMNKGNRVRVKIAVLYVKNYYIRNFWQPYNNFLGRRLLKRDGKRYANNKRYSEKLLQKGNHDVYHATYYDTYALEYNRKPMVVTIHDMIHEDSPEMFANSDKIIAQKKQMMEAAAVIIAISNYTKEKIAFHYPKFLSKIEVIHHGLPLATTGQYLPKHNIPSKYILFVGERGNYKSFQPFVEAAAPLLVANKNLNIIAVGGKPFNEAELLFLSSCAIKEQCFQINADDELLSYLYQNALVFVYPTTQEGFGLPLLEAFKNDCPVACSNSSCLPEIAGDAAAYFDTKDTVSIRQAVEKIVFDPAFADELRLKGQKRLYEFTIEKCVEKTIEVYQRATAAKN